MILTETMDVFSMMVDYSSLSFPTAQGIDKHQPSNADYSTLLRTTIQDYVHMYFDRDD